MKPFLILATLLILGTSWVSIGGTSGSTDDPIKSKIDKLKLLPGFKAEHLYRPAANKQGWWVSMTFDNKGRLAKKTPTRSTRVNTRLEFVMLWRNTRLTRYNLVAAEK